MRVHKWICATLLSFFSTAVRVVIQLAVRVPPTLVTSLARDSSEISPRSPREVRLRDRSRGSAATEKSSRAFLGTLGSAWRDGLRQHPLLAQLLDSALHPLPHPALASVPCGAEQVPSVGPGKGSPTVSGSHTLTISPAVRSDRRMGLEVTQEQP
jgi:hypothetical protein